MPEIALHPIVANLPDGFDALRADAAQEGFRFVDRLADEWNSGANRFDRPDEALMFVQADGELAGIGGLSVDPFVPKALRMRRFYVRPPFRRIGIGRLLVGALPERTRLSGRDVMVNADTPGGPFFWQAMGFTPNRVDGHTHVLRPL